MNLAADNWDDIREHELDRGSLVRHLSTSIWPPIIGTILGNMNLTADHWYDTREHELGRRILGRHSGTSNWYEDRRYGRMKIESIAV